ncbi:HNH endonuclease signature motif containing protein [Nocardioides mesophilus]|uniref:HNH endonuclease n=1 Tax=Nocardioides mesophilus TaxID=433659 RepID=A0A7G9RA63_9ACTN|nr:HNH endonuclease signature motif containing protein [Nocardioides mesophilus]QNN52488.1 HNH endonuclease [Nocardioides mesophilus]
MSNPDDVGKVCVCRKPHAPEPLDLEYHHVWPKGMGGPDVPENAVFICPTTHTNTHELLRLIVRRAGKLSWAEVTALYPVPVSRYAFDLAHLGYRRAIARSLDV